MAGESGYNVDLSAAMQMAPVAAADWLLIAPIALPLGAAALLVMLRKRTGLQAPLALAALALVMVCEVLLLARVLGEGPVAMTMGRWLPPFGISFVADTLGVTLALVAGLVGFLCGLYAIHDIDTTGRRYGFYAFLLLMIAGVNGSFLTGDIFNLYVWFEIFLISSFGLIILGSRARQLDGAVKYAVLNLVATTLFLITTGLLYGVFGTLNMADIARKAPELRDTAPLATLAMLYFTAFGMKAAAFPVSFWLPASYHTPRIVVGALFGGLLTKVGIYALLRSLVMLFPEERGDFSQTIAWVAIATMIVGALGALAQSDIRRIMGFVVISGIGVMLSGLAVGTTFGLTGTIVYALQSMVVMAALYLLAGAMRQVSGTYSLHQMAGLYRKQPMLAAAALLLMLAAAGLPPASGLWPKLYLVKASLDASQWMLAFAILLSGLLTTLALGRVFALGFWRPAPEPGTEPAEPGSARIAPVASAALVALLVPVLAMGLYPEPVLAVAADAAAGLVDPARYIGVVFTAQELP